MSLVHYYAGVHVKVRVVQRLSKEDSVCHVLDLGDLFIRDILKTNGIANELPQLAIHLFAHSFRHGDGGHSPRLGAPNRPFSRIALLMQILCELSGLTTTRLPHYNNHSVFFHHLEKFLPNRINRQELPLLLDGLELRELAHRDVLLRYRRRELVALPVIYIPLLVQHQILIPLVDLLLRLLLNFKYVAQFRPSQFPEPLPHLRLVILLSQVLKHG